MVRGILEGRKSQTRRVVKPQPVVICGKNGHAFMTHNPTRYVDGTTAWTVVHRLTPNGDNIYTKCPYGQPGDRLWVREACWILGVWQKNGLTKTGRQRWRFHQTGKAIYDKPDSTAKRGKGEGWVYRHARYMPRWASRISLEVTGVRVERVQEITEEDARAEGVREGGRFGVFVRGNFSDLWDRINAKRGYGWDVNPWVWVVEFKMV